MRFTLAGSLGFVAFFAVGFAAIRVADDFWLGATFLVTLGLLCASVLGAVLERGRGGVWWLGFALFGWALFVAGLIPGLVNQAYTPSRHVVKQIFQTSNLNRDTPPPTDRTGQEYQDYVRRQQSIPQRNNNALFIGQCFFILVFARVGATISCVFTKGLPWRRRPSSVQASSSAG